MGIEGNFLIKFFIVYSLTIFLVFVQNTLIHLIKEKSPISKKHGDLIVKLFTG